MTSVQPGNVSFEESMARIAAVIKETETDVGDIRHMSEQSFRQWLNVVVQRVADMLGIAFGTAAGWVADTISIGANAARSFRSGYREAFDRTRQIHRER